MNRRSILGALCAWVAVPTPLIAQPSSPQPLPYRVPARLPDRAEILSPAEIRLEGWLGNRVAANETNRLAQVDLEPLLAGFRQKPGVHPWIGEHVGKWLHAATLAWTHTGDPQLRRKLDYAVAELLKTQEPDGYLGTYPLEHRFAIHPGPDGHEWSGPSWDVWAHKYNLIGLLNLRHCSLTSWKASPCKPALETGRSP